MAEVEVEGKTTDPLDVDESPIITNKNIQLEVKSDPLVLIFLILIFKLDIEVYNPRGMPKSEEDPIIMISLSSNQGLQKVLSTAESSLDFVKL